MARVVVALLLAALAVAAPAHAGQVTIRTCTVDGVRYDNRAWSVEGRAANVGADDSCSNADGNIDLHVAAGSQTPDGKEAAFTFHAPAGTTIADFRLVRRLIFSGDAPAGTHPYYALYTLGDTVFAGAGNYQDATRDRLRSQHSWYTDADQHVDTGRDTVTRASFPALNGYRGDATTLALRVGCYERGTPCGTAAGARIEHAVAGAAVTLQDPVPPAELVVEASGLLSGGPRSGSDPVRIARATDNVGIRAAEILDVTDPAAPRVVGTEDYEAGRTDAGAGCSYRFAHPCPNLAAETLAPTALPAGRRQIAVRVTDAGGLSRTSDVYTVDVAAPSDRGASNGAAATEGGTLTAAFRSGRARRSAGYGDGVTIVGRLLNEAGAPVANAELRVITRDADRDRDVDRGAIHTGADGTFRYRTTAAVGQLIQFAWRAHANDPGFALSAYVRLRVRAAASLKASRSRPRLRQKVVLRGRLKGRHRNGVDVVLQGRRKGDKRYRTFAEARTRRGGRFTASYRFVRPSSHGRTFYLRARILPTGRFPYLRGYSRTVTVRIR